MRAAATLALLFGVATCDIDLGPAYRVHMTGTTDWKLVQKYSKDPKFVEGFEMLNSSSYIESVGQYWGSSIQKVALDWSQQNTAAFLSKDLPQSYFGEGCTLFNGRFYQMTYRERKVFVYDQHTLEIVEELNMPAEMEEGWGLSHDQEHLWASDGTNQIFKLDPSDFSVVKIFKVETSQGTPVRFINELEVVGDLIYGNVLPLNVVIEIDKKTGTLTNVYDFKELFNIQMKQVEQSHTYWDRTNNVMNGIAYRAETGNLLLTGKNWNFIFEVKL